jgi:hypothetical protein
MQKLKARFLVDANGKPSAVVLDLKAYRRLLQRLEDLEDALDLDKAQRAATSFRSYEAVRRELKRAGLL